jgi:hypothetical protein
MKLHFNILPIYDGTQLIQKMQQEGWNYMYRNIEWYKKFVITGFQPHQVMKIGRYGEQLKKL